MMHELIRQSHLAIFDFKNSAVVSLYQKLSDLMNKIEAKKLSKREIKYS